MDKYAVIGNPIKHSKSPQIHAQFSEQTDQQLVYDTLLAPIDEFAMAVDVFRNKGAKGANVTVPFKVDAFNYVDELSDLAKSAGAVNTLLFREDGTSFGTNTDGIGLVRDLIKNHDSPIEAKRILILGAGGAVRGILQPFMMQKPSRIFIANRTATKAKSLAEDMLQLLEEDCGTSCELNGGGFEDIEDQFDLIINGTAASLEGVMPSIPKSCLAANVHCYDMMYGDKPTAFEKWCEEQGANKIMNGFGMLIEQAAESFFIWRGMMPDTKPVLKAMR